MKKLLMLSAAILLLSACDNKKEEAATETETKVVLPANPVLEGKWTGPEGTYLSVTNLGGFYEVRIKDLDAEKMFPAQAENGNLTFTRDGIKETIKPGDGAATGMKWLADKKNCIVVKMGEGYCRD